VALANMRELADMATKSQREAFRCVRAMTKRRRGSHPKLWKKKLANATSPFESVTSVRAAELAVLDWLRPIRPLARATRTARGFSCAVVKGTMFNRIDDCSRFVSWYFIDQNMSKTARRSELARIRLGIDRRAGTLAAALARVGNGRSPPSCDSGTARLECPRGCATGAGGALWRPDGSTTGLRLTAAWKSSIALH